MLRLALYSDQMIPENQKVDNALCKLISKPYARIGYIASASDPSRRFFESRRRYYQQYNLELDLYTELDIAYNEVHVQQLFTCDAIHLSGGSTPYFLYWLRERRLMERLTDYASNNGVLIGVSAGAIVMTPSIETTYLCGDTPYALLQNTQGLGLVPFTFVPHANTIGNLDELLQTYANMHHQDVYACPDGAGIIVHGETVQCIGAVQIVQWGD